MDTRQPLAAEPHATKQLAMATFEWIIALLLGAALLAALARRMGAPYPTFLAIPTDTEPL